MISTHVETAPLQADKLPWVSPKQYLFLPFSSVYFKLQIRFPDAGAVRARCSWKLSLLLIQVPTYSHVVTYFMVVFVVLPLLPSLTGGWLPLDILGHFSLYILDTLCLCVTGFPFVVTIRFVWGAGLWGNTA